MLIEREIEGVKYRFELTKEETEEICKAIEEKKEKSLADAVRELPKGGSIEVRFNNER